MEDDSGEHCVGGASSGGFSQDGISVLDELCMGYQVYDDTAPVFHDDIVSGSIQLAHIGDGFSVKSPSPNYMDNPSSPLNKMEPAVETAAAASSDTPMASSQPQRSGDQSTASTTAAT